jgi:hypothetical protein
MERIGAHLMYDLDTGTLPLTTECYVLRVIVQDTNTGETVLEEVLLEAR